MKRILVATDGSDTANRAVDIAANLANDLGANLKIAHIVSVYDAPKDQLTEFSRQERLMPENFLNEMSEQILKAAAGRATDLGKQGVQQESKIGDPATWIIEIARRDKSDAIVIGKRGLGQLSGLLLGSVSQKVVSVAPVTVIVVP